MGSDIAYHRAADRAGKPDPVSISGAVAMFWLAAVLVLTYLGIQLTNASGLLNTPDDAMRLVQVRDLLNGQSWFNPVQYRLDAPEGVVMHWSRLIDAPIALLISVATLFASREAAEWFAAFIWPLTVLFGLIWATAQLSVRLAGSGTLIASLVLPLLCVPLLYEFLPGRFDHHGVQIVLTLLLALLVVNRDLDRRCALLAGLVTALMLAIGMETLPFAGTASLLFVGFWIVTGTPGARNLAGFGLGLGGGLASLFLLTVPPENYANAACDALSVTYVATAITGGGAAVLLALLSKQLPASRHRLAAALLTGGGAATLLAFLFPHCLAGPYGALDPRLVELWINGIQETASIFEIAAREPAQLLQYYLIPAMGLVIACLVAFRQKSGARQDWLVLAAFLAIAVLVSIVQVRGAKFASALSMPAGAWLIAWAFAKARSGDKRSHFINWAGGLSACLLFTGLVHTTLAQSLTRQEVRPSPVAAAKASRKAVRSCMRSEALAPLNAVAAGLIVAPVDLGAHILLHTSHSVLAAPYHRDQRGLLDTIAGFNAPLAEAYSRLKARNVAYLVHCPGVRLAPANGVTANDALARLLDAGAPPSWLHPVPLSGDTPIKLYSLK